MYKINLGYDELLEQTKLVLYDVYKMLLRYSDEPLSRHTRSTTEPHSFREYVVGMVFVLVLLFLSYSSTFQIAQRFSYEVIGTTVMRIINHY